MKKLPRIEKKCKKTSFIKKFDSVSHIKVHSVDLFIS